MLKPCRMSRVSNLPRCKQTGWYLPRIWGAQYANTGVGYMLLQQNWQAWHLTCMHMGQWWRRRVMILLSHEICFQWEMCCVVCCYFVTHDTTSPCHKCALQSAKCISMCVCVCVPFPKLVVLSPIGPSNWPSSSSSSIGLFLGASNTFFTFWMVGLFPLPFT